MTVNKILQRIALCTLASFVVAGVAFAQWEQNDREKLGIGFSTFMPSNGNVNDVVGSAWLGPKIMYNLAFDERDRPTSIVSAALLAKEGQNYGYDGSMFNLTYTKLKRFSNARSSWYAGGGAGVYFTDFNPRPAGESENALGMGIHVVGGRDLGRWAFVEARYDMMTNKPTLSIPAPTETNPYNRELRDVSMSGLSLTIGIRGAF